mgnify:CR=1 FL=1
MKTFDREECRRTVKGVFEAKSCQNAMRSLEKDPHACEEAEQDLAAFLRRHRVRIPEDTEVALCNGSAGRAGRARAASSKRAGRVICVVGCTKNACYIYCVRLQH